MRADQRQALRGCGEPGRRRACALRAQRADGVFSDGAEVLRWRLQDGRRLCLNLDELARTEAGTLIPARGAALLP